MTRLPREARARARGQCICWLSNNPCRRTVVRSPWPNCVYASRCPKCVNVGTAHQGKEVCSPANLAPQGALGGCVYRDMEASSIPRTFVGVRRPRRSLRFTRDEELVRLVRAGDE